MRKRSAMLALVTFGFAAIASLSVQSTHAVAADECLTKPNSPAPQGQHWYYRIDHANNRQCWRLGEEGLRVQKIAPQTQKTAPQTQKEPAPIVAAPPVAPARAQNFETTGAAAARAEATHAEAMSDANPATVATPSPWPESPRMPDLPPSVQAAPQAEPVQGVRTASAADAVPVAENSAAANEPSAPAPAEEPSQSSASPATTKSGEIDHTFALLMIVFAVLGIAGPIIHFVDRRRKRRIIITEQEPPRWARVVNLNAPAPRVQLPLPSDPPVTRRTPPIPPTPIEQTERLAQALQQLVDRLHAQPHPEPGAATPPVQRADVETIRKRPIALRN
jgi:hypothetical protein